MAQFNCSTSRSEIKKKKVKFFLQSFVKWPLYFIIAGRHREQFIIHLENSMLLFLEEHNLMVGIPSTFNRASWGYELLNVGTVCLMHGKCSFVRSFYVAIGHLSLMLQQWLFGIGRVGRNDF